MRSLLSLRVIIYYIILHICTLDIFIITHYKASARSLRSLTDRVSAIIRFKETTSHIDGALAGYKIYKSIYIKRKLYINVTSIIRSPFLSVPSHSFFYYF